MGRRGRSRAGARPIHGWLVLDKPSGITAAAVVAALRRAAAFFRGRIAREVKVRFVPLLSFEPDMSFEIASRIDALLHSPAVARDTGAGAGAPDQEGAGATGPAKRPEGGRHGA